MVLHMSEDLNLQVNETTVSRSYKLSRDYAKESLEAHESVSFTGTPTDALIVSRLVSQKAKLTVWIEAVELGMIPTDDATYNGSIVEHTLTAIKDSLGDSNLSQEATPTIVGLILVVEDLLGILESVTKPK